MQATKEEQEAWKVKAEPVQNADRRNCRTRCARRPTAKRTASPCSSTIWKTSCRRRCPPIYAVADDPKEATPIEMLFHGDYLQPTAKVGARPLGILLPENAPEEPVDIDNAPAQTGQLDCRCQPIRSLRG